MHLLCRDPDGLLYENYACGGAFTTAGAWKTSGPTDSCAAGIQGMTRNLRSVLMLVGLTIATFAAAPAFAQKSGGILRLSHFDSPASMSILEESTRATLQPMMRVFNNLVM